MNTTTNDAPFKLFNFGKSATYKQQVNTESPRPTGITHDGKDIVDLTDDDTQIYHVTQQDLQSEEFSSNPYKVSIKIRLLKKIDDDERNAKWEEMRHPKQHLLDTRNFGTYKELVRCGICDPRGLMFWGLLVTWVGCFIVPFMLFITSDPTNPNLSVGNASKVVGFAFWFAFGALIAGVLTIYCYYREKSPDPQEMGEMKAAIKRRDIYNMYCFSNNFLVEHATDNYYVSDSKKDFYQEKIEKWFNGYRIKIVSSNLKPEDKSSFKTLLNRHLTVLLDLIVNHNASWLDDETAMAEILKRLLCSEDENCCQLTETWATEFAKFGRDIL